MSVAAGSGRIHDGLKFCIVLRLGTTDDFKPDGANMIKLCANDGAWNADYLIYYDELL